VVVAGVLCNRWVWEEVCVRSGLVVCRDGRPLGAECDAGLSWFSVFSAVNGSVGGSAVACVVTDHRGDGFPFAIGDAVDAVLVEDLAELDQAQVAQFEVGGD
jgi:hypothetical protein